MGHAKQGSGNIPDKLYFKIGEVSGIVGVDPHVLRYWESEFRLMSPQKSRSKQRLYRQKDIETILAIKRLLYDEGFRIAGARKIRRQELAAPKQESKPAPPQYHRIVHGRSLLSRR